MTPFDDPVVPWKRRNILMFNVAYVGVIFLIGLGIWLLGHRDSLDEPIHWERLPLVIALTAILASGTLAFFLMLPEFIKDWLAPSQHDWRFVAVEPLVLPSGQPQSQLNDRSNRMGDSDKRHT